MGISAMGSKQYIPFFGGLADISSPPDVSI